MDCLFVPLENGLHFLVFSCQVILDYILGFVKVMLWGFRIEVH